MFERMQIPEVILVTPRRFGDDRGYFRETYKTTTYHDCGIDVIFVQDNHSYSKDQGVLRGLHFQTAPHAQDKLVFCTRGRILDVAVDIRHGSPTFGQHVRAELSAENGQQLFVPKGFAHAFLTLVPDCEVQYKCSDVYSPECDAGLAWDDPALGIDWPLPETGAVTSDKDKIHPKLAELPEYFRYE